jgi:hypothetical protein
VCRHDGDIHEQHCHHAHALLFPDAPKITKRAMGYYGKHRKFAKLSDALEYASLHDNYFLISESLTEYVILSRPLNVPRQLSRFLVAATTGQSPNSDWRTNPNWDETIRNAKALALLWEQTNE